MAHKQWRFRFVVPLDNPKGRPQFGSLNVFVGSEEILFEGFCPVGSRGYEASTEALAVLKRHCIQNDIAFRIKTSQGPHVRTVSKKIGIPLGLTSDTQRV